MIRLSLFTFGLFIGLSMVIAKTDVKFRHIHQKRFSRNSEHQQHQQQRTLRNLMGKLIDTETNVIYNVDGEKFKDISLNSDAATITTTATTSIMHNEVPNHEQIACLAACHSCVEEFFLESVSVLFIKLMFYYQSFLLFQRKKRAADNCGPMCDCADSCFLMPIEQVARETNTSFHFFFEYFQQSI